jgi:Uma2 family endonuclease
VPAAGWLYEAISAPVVFLRAARSPRGWYGSRVIALDLIDPEKPRRIARAEYDRMVAMGLFEGEHVELLHGVIIAMTPPNDPPHASPVQLLTELLILGLARRASVRVQLPLAAADESEPEPDIAVVPRGDYARTHPDRAHLVIEVADSSLRKDRLIKAPLYAASGFEEYWLVNVAAKLVEVHRIPSADGWASVTRHDQSATLEPLAFPDLTIRVSDFIR